MDNLSFLYLLIFPAQKMMKIGKANNIYNRIQSLTRTWGEVDFERSYQIIVPQSEVFKLEKMLHFLLTNYRQALMQAMVIPNCLPLRHWNLRLSIFIMLLIMK